MTDIVSTRRSCFLTGPHPSRRAFRVGPILRCLAILLSMTPMMQAGAYTLPGFLPIDHKVECTGPTEHPICAIKTFVECERGLLKSGCEAVGMILDEKSKADFLSKWGYAREEPWTFTFSEAHGEAIDYIFFGQRVVGSERFRTAKSPIRFDTDSVTEVKVKGCDIDVYECTEEVWSYFLKQEESGEWRMLGQAAWDYGVASEACLSKEAPQPSYEYCYWSIPGLQE